MKQFQCSLLITNGRGKEVAKNCIINSKNLQYFSEIIVLRLTDREELEGEKIGDFCVSYVYFQNTRYVNKSRLKGAKLSKSKYILLLDDDDFVNGSFLLNDTHILDNDCDAFVLGGVLQDKLSGRERPLAELTETSVKQCVWGGYSRVVVRTEIILNYLPKIGHMVAFQDQALWILLLYAGCSVKYVSGNHIIYDATTNKDSVTKSITKAIVGYWQLLLLWFSLQSVFRPTVKSFHIFIGIHRALFKRIFINIYIRTWKNIQH